MRDRDTKFTASFDAIFDEIGADTKETAFRSPNAYDGDVTETPRQRSNAGPIWRC